MELTQNQINEIEEIALNCEGAEFEREIRRIIKVQ
jgi:hypothetical protein